MAQEQHVVEAAIAMAKAEILYDIAIGQVPESVASFTDLHGYVDANEYGGFTDDESPFSIDETNEIQEVLDEWLKAGRPA